MTRIDKLQHLLITHLREAGVVKLTLPDGILLEIGITQENNRFGDLYIDKDDDYCWVTARKLDKEVALDSFNLGLSFMDNPSTIIFEDINTNEVGMSIKTLDVV